MNEGLLKAHLNGKNGRFFFPSGTVYKADFIRMNPKSTNVQFVVERKLWFRHAEPSSISCVKLEDEEYVYVYLDGFKIFIPLTEAFFSNNTVAVRYTAPSHYVMSGKIEFVLD